MSKTKLTKMQQHYIWLAGSYPHLTVEQGRGYRGWPLKFAVDEEDERLVLFGYSTPLYFMRGRYFRQLQDNRQWTLTDAGEEEFKRLHIGQFGLRADVRAVKLAQRELDV